MRAIGAITPPARGGSAPRVVTLRAHMTARLDQADRVGKAKRVEMACQVDATSRVGPAVWADTAAKAWATAGLGMTAGVDMAAGALRMSRMVKRIFTISVGSNVGGDR